MGIAGENDGAAAKSDFGILRRPFVYFCELCVRR